MNKSILIFGVIALVAATPRALGDDFGYACDVPSSQPSVNEIDDCARKLDAQLRQLEEYYRLHPGESPGELPATEAARRLRVRKPVPGEVPVGEDGPAKEVPIR